MLLMLQAFPTKHVAQVQMPRGGILPANFGKQGHEQKAGQEEVCPPGLQGFPDDPILRVPHVSVAGAGLSPAWPGSFVLTMLFTTGLSFARVCNEDLNASLFAPISSTAFEALDIAYFMAISSLLPTEGPSDMAEEIFLLHIVVPKGFTTFT